MEGGQGNFCDLRCAARIRWKGILCRTSDLGDSEDPSTNLSDATRNAININTHTVTDTYDERRGFFFCPALSFPSPLLCLLYSVTLFCSRFPQLYIHDSPIVVCVCERARASKTTDARQLSARHKFPRPSRASRPYRESIFFVAVLYRVILFVGRIIARLNDSQNLLLTLYCFQTVYAVVHIIITT